MLRRILPPLLLLGCGAARSSVPLARQSPLLPSSAPAVARQAPLAVAPGVVDRRSSCEVLQARHQQTLRQLPRLSEACMAVPYLSPAAPFSCQPSPRGAWALVASPVTADTWPRAADEDPECHIQSPTLLLDLVFRFDAGQELAMSGLTYDMDAWGGTTTTLGTVFDYDGDGLPEAAVCVTEEGEGTYSDGCRLHTLRAGAIVPYAPAAAFHDYGLQDVDGDGRADLFFAAHRAVTSSAGNAGTSVDFIGMAHSLADGTFSDDDAAVTSYYRRECPQRPSRVVELQGKLRNDEATGHNIVCARAWGVPSSSVRSELEHACRAWSGRLSDGIDPRATPPNQPCPNWWLDWLREAKDRGVR